METAFIILLASLLGVSLYFNWYLYRAVKLYRFHIQKHAKQLPLIFGVMFALGGIFGFNVSKLLNENAHNPDSQ